MTQRTKQACADLIKIVDGIRDAGWVSNPSEPVRLKDTKEWCEFYVAFHDELRIEAQRRVEEK
jgi:hypothetical protein